MQANEILRTAVRALDGKKAQDIQIIEIGDLTILADYFLLASGTSSTQVRALAEEVEDRLSKQGLEPHHIEGRATGWILLDYGSVVVHVFHAQQREFYALERLWDDGKPVSTDLFLEDEPPEAPSPESV